MTLSGSEVRAVIDKVYADQAGALRHRDFDRQVYGYEGDRHRHRYKTHDTDMRTHYEDVGRCLGLPPDDVELFSDCMAGYAITPAEEVSLHDSLNGSGAYSSLVDKLSDLGTRLSLNTNTANGSESIDLDTPWQIAQRLADTLAFLKRNVDPDPSSTSAAVTESIDPPLDECSLTWNRRRPQPVPKPRRTAVVKNSLGDPDPLPEVPSSRQAIDATDSTRASGRSGSRLRDKIDTTISKWRQRRSSS